MNSHLEFNELAFDKQENQAGLAGAHIPEKNLATQSNAPIKRVSTLQSSRKHQTLIETHHLLNGCG
jgi:hypothetical protein